MSEPMSIVLVVILLVISASLTLIFGMAKQIEYPDQIKRIENNSD